MFGIVRLALAKYVWLDPDTGYILMKYMILVDMGEPEMGIEFFSLEQIDFPSVVAVIAGLSMDAVHGVSSSFGDLLVVALAYISRHF